MKGYLSPEDISLFHAQGFILKPKCFDKDDMCAVKSKLLTVIDIVKQEASKSLYKVSGEEEFIFIGGSKILFKKYPTSISIQKVNGCCGIQPSLQEAVRSTRLVHTFFELLGTNDLEHIIAQFHPKLPGDGIAFERHHDLQFRKKYDNNWKDILGNGSYAICIIPVDPMSPENGGLWVDSEQFKKDKAKIIQGGQKNEGDLQEVKTYICAEPGDLLFIHPELYHGSAANVSQVQSRMTLLTGFCAFGANSKPYPGADVNRRLTLGEDGLIQVSQTPWCTDSVDTPSFGH